MSAATGENRRKHKLSLPVVQCVPSIEPCILPCLTRIRYLSVLRYPSVICCSYLPCLPAENTYLLTVPAYLPTLPYLRCLYSVQLIVTKLHINTSASCSYVQLLQTIKLNIYLENQTATMVHLAPIPNDSEIQQPAKGSPKIPFPELDDNEMSTSVYGSRYAAQDLPHTEMPEKEMPKDVAYKMIK